MAENPEPDGDMERSGRCTKLFPVVSRNPGWRDRQPNRRHATALYRWRGPDAALWRSGDDAQRRSEESWAFVLVDIGLVALAALIAYGAMTLVSGG